MSIKKRFTLLAGFLAALVIIKAGILLTETSAIADQSSIFTQQEIPILGKAHELKLAVVQVQQWLTDISATRGRDGLDDGFTVAEENAQSFKSLITELQELDSANTQGYQSMLPVFDAYYETGKRMAQAYIDKGPEGGNLLMAEFDQVAAKISAQVDALLVQSEARTATAITSQAANINNIKWSLVIGGVIVLIGIVMLYVITSHALAPLPRVAEALARGDLSASFAAERDDEIGQIMRSIQAVRERLTGMIDQIKEVSGQLTATASNMATTSTQTSDNIKQLHMETDQSATAMNEMAATAQEVANSIANTASAAQSANKETAAGHQIVDQAITRISELATHIESAAETMQQLEQDSQSISTVAEVINSIAEQTNLLALNAAIEAARAGEHGRGFAVVADEVRTLASRTQQSTQEINQIIEKLQGGTQQATGTMNQSRDQARLAVEQAESAGASLSSIAEAVKQIDDMSAQIANASNEQLGVADEVNRNITKISDMAARSGEGAEQTANASQELSQLAARLETVMVHFKV